MKPRVSVLFVLFCLLLTKLASFLLRLTTSTAYLCIRRTEITLTPGKTADKAPSQRSDCSSVSLRV